MYVWRWLETEAGRPPPDTVSGVAWHLLARRIAVRKQAARVVSLGFGTVMVLFVAAVVLALASAVSLSFGVSASAFVAGIVAIESLAVLQDRMVMNGDRVISAGLAQHVSRGDRMSVVAALGRRRTALAALGLALSIVYMITYASLALAKSATVAWIPCLGMAVAATMCAIRIARTATRPTIAVDDLSLAIDHRLRWNDASRAMQVLGSAGFLGNLVVITHHWRGIAAAIAFATPILVTLVSAAFEQSSRRRQWMWPWA